MPLSEEAHGRATVLWLRATLVVSALGVISLCAAFMVVHNRQQAVLSRQLELSQLRGEIVHLDEVLSMSARTAALTGDAKWEARYLGSEPRLNAAIRRVLALAGAEAEAVDAVKQAELSNEVLLDLERRAFAAVRQGRLAEAQGLLQGATYSANKARYAEGMAKLDARLEEAGRAEVLATSRAASFAFTAMVAVLLLLAVTWTLSMRASRRWQLEVLEGNEALQERTRSLEDLNWRQGGVARVTRVLGEEGSLIKVVTETLSCLAELLSLQVAALYQPQEEGSTRFELLASFGFSEASGLPEDFELGEGLIGAALNAREVVVVEPSSDQPLRASFGVGHLELRSLAIVPLVEREKSQGVLVLGSVNAIDERSRALLSEVSREIAHALEVIRVRRTTRWLLEESQLLAGELRRQNVEIASQRAVLDQRNLELQQANKHQSAFLASMSHELRTPLNAMIGFTSLSLQRLSETVPASDLTHLRSAERSARGLLALLGNVLDFSKIEAGRIEVFLEDLQLSELLGDCVMTTQGLLLERSEISLVRMIAPDLPTVRSDYTKLKQIVNNLLSNAVKATSKGMITLSAERGEGDVVRVSVRDTGCGISPADQARIFEPFQQADSSIRRTFGGTGLGLAITRRFATHLGVELSLESELGVGTTFTLSIPCVPAEAEDPAPADAEKPEVGVTQSGPRTPEEQRALFTRDELLAVTPTPAGELAVVATLGSSDLLEKLRLALTQHLPFEVVAVESEADLLELNRERALWALVVQPSAEGLDLVARLSGDLARVPVLLCSSEPDLAAFHLARVEAVSAPVDQEELISTLLRVVPWEQGKVLVVEDDEASRALYETLLFRHGYEPIGVGDGAAAIAHLQGPAKLPQAILLDLLMPGTDGFEVLQALQRDDELCRIPVMILTNKDLSADERRRLQEGAAVLARKSELGPERLPQRVARMIDGVLAANARKVLVVDDNVDNRVLLVEVFRDAGYEVFGAEGGQQGVDLALEHRPDVIVMDLAMPGMSGFEATELLRADPRTADAVIVACSAFALAEYRTKASEAGCDAFLTKPIEPTRLVALVRRIALAAKVRRKVSPRKETAS